MASPLLFVNVGWMKWYEGNDPSDPIIGGGTYVEENETGGEIYNFKPRGKYIYGFAPPYGNVNIARLGATSDAEFLDDVTVVRTAASAKFGRVIIGWYRMPGFGAAAKILKMAASTPLGRGSSTARCSRRSPTMSAYSRFHAGETEKSVWGNPTSGTPTSRGTII